MKNSELTWSTGGCAGLLAFEPAAQTAGVQIAHMFPPKHSYGSPTNTLLSCHAFWSFSAAAVSLTPACRGVLCGAAAGCQQGQLVAQGSQELFILRI